MVVIRIKNDGNNQFPEKISSQNIKVLSDLKLCKILENDYDEKIEKKIEFVTSDNTNNINNIYGIYNIIKNEHNFFEYNKWNKSGYSIDTNQYNTHRRTNNAINSSSNSSLNTKFNNSGYNSTYNSCDNATTKNRDSYASSNKGGHKYFDRNTSPSPREKFTRQEQRDNTGESYKKSYGRSKYS
jgi:hypothetical protein